MVNTPETPTEATPKVQVVHGHWPLQTRLMLRKEYVTGKGSLPALCEKHRIPYLTAKDWHIKGEWEPLKKKWLAKAESSLKRMVEDDRPMPDPLKPEPAPMTETANPNRSLGERARVINGLIEQTEGAYVEAIDPREMQSLAMALDRLYQTWADLTGHERRGVSRAKKKKPGLDAPAMLDQPESEE